MLATEGAVRTAKEEGKAVWWMPRSSVSVGGASAVAAKACNVMAKGVAG
jgi:hypothetical protein